MALNTDQKASKNFKKLIGKAETTTSREFYSEPYSGKASVLPSQIWDEAGDIPNTAPVLAPDAVSGVVQYKEDLVLTAVSGTSNAFYHADLVDAIPFYYGDGTSYLYTLKDSTGATIPAGSGDWIVDPDAGVLSFYGTVPANMPPKITFYKYVGTKGLRTLTDASFGAEESDRTIYIDPAGDDTTGDGSSGSPFFSLHRAVEDIKTTIASNVTVTIEVADGNYDFSSLGDLVINRDSFQGGIIKIIPSSSTMIDHFNIIATDTFDSSANNVHTKAAGSFPDYSSYMIKVDSNASGAVSMDFGGYQDYSITGIVKNNTTTLDSGFYGYTTGNQDILNFRIIEHKIQMNFGSNDIKQSESIGTQVHCMRLYGTGTLFAGRTFNGTFRIYNCILDMKAVANNGLYFLNSTVSLTQAAELHGCYDGVFKTTLNSSSAFKLQAYDLYNIAIYQPTYNNNLAYIDSLGGVTTSNVLYGNIKSYNAKYGIGLFANTLNGYNDTVFSHDNVGFTLRCNDMKDINYIFRAGYYASFYNEPSTGRLTIDGTNATNEYYNSELGLNMLAIAPDAYK